jgi:hypothetical protein
LIALAVSADALTDARNAESESPMLNVEHAQALRNAKPSWSDSEGKIQKSRHASYSLHANGMRCVEKNL